MSFLLMLVSIAILSSSFVGKPAKPVKRKKSAAKALAFPVAGKKSNIGSYWGADRDGGRRKHKGIDIFARKGTPVVAISDGIIVEKDHTPIGGKTLWLRSSDHQLTAYYAHLDKQSVKEGQHVRKGQVIGTVGNTGNALTTPSHLHFGIYKGSGPVNPLPYVKNATKVAAPKVLSAKKHTVSKSTTAKSRANRKSYSISRSSKRATAHR
jgi:murein DD-endopeptidase MepM/ murein hydrolase activator NlpD